MRARGIDFAVYHTPPVNNALPLLCINGGLLFDHKLLWPALAPLADKRQLIFYDQRGRGASSIPPGLLASRIAFDAADVPALRSALGIKQWDVLGHSWGGGIAMLATALEEQQARGAETPAVHRLVLVDAVGVESTWLNGLHEAGLARLTGPAHDKLASMDPKQLVNPDIDYHARYAQAYFPAWFADPVFAGNVSPPLGKSATGAAVAARLRREGYDWREMLSDLRTRTLVLHGAADVLPFAEAERSTALFRDARLVPIPEAGHNPFWEAPEAFFSAVRAFLDDDSPP